MAYGGGCGDIAAGCHELIIDESCYKVSLLVNVDCFDDGSCSYFGDCYYCFGIAGCNDFYCLILDLKYAHLFIF